jgi:DNA replication protein DnaC
MLNEETHHKLMAMKMHGLAAAFEEYLDERRHDKLAFEERFGLMVDREWIERQERRLKRRLRVAKLREQACTEDINYRHPRNLDRSVIQRLTKCKWISDHENVAISGATGLGKTWIACALANKACRDGFSATYTRVPRLMHTLQIAKADGTYMKELARLAKTDVLILDDLGLSPIGEVERRDLLEILEDRHGNRSTIVTSQYPIKKWHDTIGDPTISDAFLDRLLNRAHRIELKGRRSMRGPESQDASSRASKPRKA